MSQQCKAGRKWEHYQSKDRSVIRREWEHYQSKDQSVIRREWEHYQSKDQSVIRREWEHYQSKDPSVIQICMVCYIIRWRHCLSWMSKLLWVCNVWNTFVSYEGWHIISNFNKCIFSLFFYIKYQYIPLIGWRSIVTYNTIFQLSIHIYFILIIVRMAVWNFVLFYSMLKLNFFSALEKRRKNHISHQSNAKRSQICHLAALCILIYHLAALSICWILRVSYMDCFSVGYKALMTTLVNCSPAGWFLYIILK